jgi:multimeric flavodoxin WrbA
MLPPSKRPACSQKEDAAAVLEKMVAADVVMATPVYFCTMAAQMKTLVDRTCCCYTEMKRTESYSIVTAADTSNQAMERSLEGFKGFTPLLGGAIEKGVVCGTGAWGAGDIKGSRAMEQARQMGTTA